MIKFKSTFLVADDFEGFIIFYLTHIFDNFLNKFCYYATIFVVAIQTILRLVLAILKAKIRGQFLVNLLLELRYWKNR